MVPDRYRTVVLEARRVREAIWPTVRATHACLYEAVTLQALLILRADLRTMLQAGTAQWPMVRPEQDDGVSATHFSYQWDLQEAVPMIITGKLPELHCWLAYRSPEAPEGTIVDTTSGSWPERARTGDYGWSALSPPDCLWATGTQLGALAEERGFGITYAPDIQACMAADAFAHHGIYGPVTEHLGVEWRPR